MNKHYILKSYIDSLILEGYKDNDNLEYEYAYNCVNPASVNELDFIVDNMKPISVDLFLKHVSLNQINDVLMYGISYNSKQRLKNDYNVSFYKINKNGIDAYIFVNSAIEYIFKAHR